MSDKPKTPRPEPPPPLRFDDDGMSWRELVAFVVIIGAIFCVLYLVAR